MDFFKIDAQYVRSANTTYVKPNFIVGQSKDLLIKGGGFYAVWDEEKGLWSTDCDDVIRLVDKELYKYAEELKNKSENRSYVEVRSMQSYSSKVWSEFKRYMKESTDSRPVLDSKILFLNNEIKRTDYASKRLSYKIEDGPMDAYEEIMNTLYDPEERDKLEWAIGAIISGDARSIQKFIVLYGDSGTGKSTILNIIADMFESYACCRLDAKALSRNSDNFATEQLASNPLILIQHDGDLSHIEDNTKLNSIVSHEEITIKEKYKSGWGLKPQSFIFMGTNKPVQITDAKSGLLRRLIDVHPTGNLIPVRRYDKLMKQVKFEYGAIASYCLKKYQSMGKNYYNTYKPLLMQKKTDYFFNFVKDNYTYFKNENEITLKAAYEIYKQYYADSNDKYILPKMKFRDEFENYWDELKDTSRNKDGLLVTNLYRGFKTERFGFPREKKEEDEPKKEDETNPEINKVDETGWLIFKDKESNGKSKLDELYSDCLAQYAKADDTPSRKWENVKTKLREIDTSKMHYVKTPENLIVIDFDIKNENGEKDYQKNLEAANKWPKTYAELSKSGSGIHLHYIYDGDVSKLSRVYDDNVEIKVYTGNAALRRKLTKYNNCEIAHINSGLPLREEKMVNFEGVKNEKSIRTLIEKNLNKEYHAGTKPSIDFIDKILEDAYNSGMHYDVTDLRPAVLYFASLSTNHATYCMTKVKNMKFKSEEASDYVKAEKDDIIFYDVEVFPNLFVVVWKPDGKECIKWINPTSAQIEQLIKFNLIGFNNRRYDNHILYARLMGYDNEQLYNLSQRIVSGSPNCLFGEAYNLSYTDVYDFASATHKQSLKKFEIELGIHHQELGLPWDQPVPEDMWETVAEYCINDVVATEATFHYLSADWTARKILAELSGLSYNDTTNAHSTRIIFGNNKHPQNEFNYTDLSEMFPGYKFDNGKSTYKGVEVGEGGYVYAEPGMYKNVALLDIASMHPSSIENLNLFGDKYTKIFSEIKQVRVYIKHKEFDKAAELFGGKLKPYLEDETMAKDLSNALKTVINSVYGLTSAGFDNPFRDPRNIDNIVAKRGALFMVNLKEEVQKRGFTVAHIKTDSIKIPDATPEIISFVMDYGKQYGYTFEHEATYDKMCLVNNAVYIARYKSAGLCNMMYDYIPGDNAKHGGEWTATGTQFAVPYVFKTLFSHEPIVFRDLCEIKNVTTAIYLDLNENLPEGEHNYKFVGKTGLFTPIKPGCGGGWLVSQREDKKNGGYKYDSVTGTKDFRWLESEIVEQLHKENDVDKRYHQNLVDEAVANISQYGDIDWLTAEEETDIIFSNTPKQMVA